MAGPPTTLAAWALEGLPFAGKSSTGGFLKEIWPEILLLPDYHDLVPADQQRELAQMPVSPAEQRRRIETYLELDRTRWRTLLAAQQRPAVLDRCHLSLMAYAIALEPTIGSRASSQSLARIERALRDPAHPLSQPTGVVYLEMSARTASSRCQRYATAMYRNLRTVGFARALIEAYEHLLTSSEIDVVRCSSEQPLDALHAGVASVLRSRLV